MSDKKLKKFPKLTKGDLIDAIREKDERLKYVVIRQVLNLAHECMVDALKEGKEIQIKNHLTIYPYPQKSRVGFNPNTQERMLTKSKVITKVEIGDELKNATSNLDFNKMLEYKKG